MPDPYDFEADRVKDALANGHVNEAFVHGQMQIHFVLVDIAMQLKEQTDLLRQIAESNERGFLKT